MKTFDEISSEELKEDVFEAYASYELGGKGSKMVIRKLAEFDKLQIGEEMYFARFAVFCGGVGIDRKLPKDGYGITKLDPDTGIIAHYYRVYADYYSPPFWDIRTKDDLRKLFVEIYQELYPENIKESQATKINRIVEAAKTKIKDEMNRQNIIDDSDYLNGFLEELIWSCCEQISNLYPDKLFEHFIDDNYNTYREILEDYLKQNYPR